MLGKFLSADFFYPFTVAFLLSLAFTIPVMRMAMRFGLVDDPRRKHPAILHGKVVPRAGGLPMFFAFLCTSLIFVPMSYALVLIFLGGFLNLCIGVIDDRYDLSPWPRLGVEVLSALLVLFAGITSHHIITNPLGGVIHLDTVQFNMGGKTFFLFADLFLIVWIVGMMHMVNWTKGASQLPGMAVIAFLTLAAVALKYQAGNPAQSLTAQLSLILAGAVLAFLPFNFPPERMMPGFGASTFIGYNLAVLSLLSGGKLAAAILVLGVPAIDMVITFARRVFTGKSPFYGDRGHLYHRLLEFGLSKRQVILVYWMITGLLGILAVNLQSKGKLFAIGMVTMAVVFAFTLLNLFLKSR